MDCAGRSIRYIDLILIIKLCHGAHGQASGIKSNIEGAQYGRETVFTSQQEDWHPRV
jgi:hypothetical protein